MSNNNTERKTREQIKRIRIILAVVILLIILAQAFFTGPDEPNPVVEVKTTEQTVEKTIVKIPENEAEPSSEYVDYYFKNRDAKWEHYEKHGIEMGFESADDYEAAASAVVNNPAALHKLEAEDNDDVYYLEETNEFVIVSTYGYIRTYFKPDRGKAYFDAQ